MGIREKFHDGKRVKEWWGSTGRPLSEAYARKAGGLALRGAKRGGELVIKGSVPYVERMAKHLRKEHPSTRRRMKVRRPRGAGYFCHYCHRTFRSYKKRDRHQARCPYRRLGR